MTPESTVKSKDADQDLKDAAQSISDHKKEKGRSELQDEADKINLGIGAGVTVATGLMPASRATGIVVGLSSGVATSTVVKVSPEQLSKTHKLTKEEIK